MKWYATAAIALLLLVSYAYYTINKEDALRNVVTDIKLYMAKLETLKREVQSLEELRDRGAALDKTAENLKAKEGELKGKYGDMKSLEAQCEALSNNCAAINVNIDDLNKRLDSLRDDMAKSINYTNALDKAIDRLRGDRDSVSDEIRRLQGERDQFKRQRDTEEKRYDEQKRIADSEALRAKEEKKRADAAKLAADVAEQDAEITLATQKKRIADARADADKDVSAHAKRKVEAEKEAGAAVAKAEAEFAKLKSLSSEVAALESRRSELSGINEQLSDAKVKLKGEQDKLGKARAQVAAQDIARQVDQIREGVARSLKEFSSKLEEFSKKQNNEVKQGGLE